MSKSNIHKKETWEDRFSRHRSTWARNNRKAWMFWKKRNRKIFRRKKKEEIREYGNHPQ